jgi:uncharacterized membrane protein YeaQ/YmgE (transglycosylase-associated protein family)
MHILMLLILPLLTGWVATLIMEADVQKVTVSNFLVGIIGALLGGWLLAPLLGISTLDEHGFSIAGMLLSLIGAIAVLGIVNFVRRRRRAANAAIVTDRAETQGREPRTDDRCNPTGIGSGDSPTQ